MSKNLTLYEHIVKQNIIDPAKISSYKNLENHTFFDLLKNKFQLDESILLNSLAPFCQATVSQLNNLTADPKLEQKYPQMLSQNLIPIYEDLNHVGVATDNPFHPELINFKTTFPKNLQLFLITSAEVQAFFNNRNKTSGSYQALDDLIISAITKNASDIHLYQKKDKIHCYLRISGELSSFKTFSSDIGKTLISQLKIKSKMDISLFNLPQDGRLTYAHNNAAFDIRVSSLPTVFGEDFVLRLFNQNNLNFNLDALGFSSTQLIEIKKILQNQFGLILVTGPTGSGKTTTLYSFISYLKEIKNLNIISLEDPIEYIIDGIRQSEINPKINYNFPEGLKAILRQDPDVIMIGEIRDDKTAKTSLAAAYTGHLVLSSLHTGDIKSTLARLSSFNLDPFLITQSLKGIISQKLVPLLCPKCQEKSKSSVFEQSFQTKGCESCSFTGISGRTIVSELLIPNPKKTNTGDINSLISNGKFLSFKEDLTSKVLTGLISENEAIKFLND
jgi:type IV pilus assembly protein PilB